MVKSTSKNSQEYFEKEALPGTKIPARAQSRLSSPPLLLLARSCPSASQPSQVLVQTGDAPATGLLLGLFALWVLCFAPVSRPLLAFLISISSSLLLGKTFFLTSPILNHFPLLSTSFFPSLRLFQFAIMWSLVWLFDEWLFFFFLDHKLRVGFQ